MTIKTGHKVKFADCAKHLKSYDKDAVGVVDRNTVYGGTTEKNNFKVTFEYPDGRKLTLPAVSKKNLTRFRGTQYEEAKRNEPDSEGWIKWEGGECPVEGGSFVDVKYNMHPKIDQWICESQLQWNHQANSSVNIIAYRLHKPTEATAEQDNDEMTTLHDWVHELESINERAIELRELITKEVQKCGGSVEWGDVSPPVDDSGQMDWRDLKPGDYIVFDNIGDNDWSNIEVGQKIKVLSVESREHEGADNIETKDHWIDGDTGSWRKLG